MGKLTVGFVAALCSFALLSGGCAKKELVKGEGTVPAAATQPGEKQPSTKPEVKEEMVHERTVKEAPTTTADEGKSATMPLVSLENIYFDFDSYVLSAQARETLTRNADLIKKNAAVNIQITGNCDERGSDEYNLALGEKRAKAAMNYLTTLGVSASRLSVISYGKEKPVCTESTEECWQKNRRDDFIAQ